MALDARQQGRGSGPQDERMAVGGGTHKIREHAHHETEVVPQLVLHVRDVDPRSIGPLRGPDHLVDDHLGVLLGVPEGPGQFDHIAQGGGQSTAAFSGLAKPHKQG